MKSKFKVSTFWDTRAENKKTNESRIMLVVILNRKQFLVSIRTYSTKFDYDKATGGRSLTDSQKVLRNTINEYVLKAESLLDRLTEPTKDIFLKFFKSDTNLSNASKINVHSLFDIKYNSLMKEGRFGSAECVKCAGKSFKNFKKELFLEDIDESFLKLYRNWMMQKGLSATTTGIYLRNLRSIFNSSVEDGLISGYAKPFKNIPISCAVKSKSVLYPNQLKALWEYRSDSKRDQRAVSFFFFCYLANGMNFKDLGHLKYKNLKGDILSYVREKTKRTKNSQCVIRIHLQDAMKKIIAVWGNSTVNPENYIFPLIPKYNSDLHMDKTITRYKRTCNKSLSRIGIELGFDVHLCLNLARHSFATKQKIDGTPIAFISDAMGHSSMTVTEHYLKSLPDDKLIEMNSKLLSF